MNIRLILLALILVLLFGCALAESTPTEIAMSSADPNTKSDYTGTYHLIWNEEAGCHLYVLHVHSQQAFDEITIELYCNRGPPSYNSGYIMDTLLAYENLAVYSSDHGDCAIILEFSEASVSLTQIGQPGDCGFGGGVFAHGIYDLVNERNPPLGCLNPQSPCDSND